jgi:outer membrane cobalamin receptor
MAAGINRGIVTNNYGFYSLGLPTGAHRLLFSYVGYEPLDTLLNLNGNISLKIALHENTKKLDEVVVNANNDREKVRKTGMGVETLTMKSISNLPVVFGESDVLKVIQLMPGVQPASEGSSGFNVRGGSYDQNLLLLDEAVVYNPGHIFSFVSVFNDDAINSMTLYKGTMPAEYGGRASSVLDISMKEGNNKTFSGKGSIGIIASKLTLEGPIVKDKSSFLISARRSTIDLIARPMLNMHGGSMKNDNYYFYDINAKVNYRFSDKDRLFFSNYFGRDVFNFGTDDNRFKLDIPWGNLTSTLRWNHLFSDKLFMNVSLIHNGFFRDMKTTQDGFSETKNSQISDQSLKADLTWYTSVNHRIKTGGQIINHLFTTDNNNTIEKRRGAEFSAFLLDEFDLGADLRFNIGARFNQFNFMGPYDEYSFNENKEPVKLIKSYSDFETVKTYKNIEPRASVRYMISKKSSIKLAYTQNSQFVHLISNSGSALPLDFWVPSSKLVKPQLSDQFSIGYTLYFNKDKLLFTAELYRKSMENLIEFGDDFVPSYTNNSELDYVFGEGTSHGVELMLKKSTGKLQGWIGYTFSNTNRKFDKLNEGTEFPANTDIMHDISVVATFVLSEHWTFGADFVFKSGKPFTVPTSRYFMDGELVDQYSERNNVRLPAYNRLDISATYKPTPKYKRFNSEWVFAIYNVYNQMNPTFVYFDNQGTTSENNFVTKTKSVTLLPFMPSISYKFNF